KTARRQNRMPFSDKIFRLRADRLKMILRVLIMILLASPAAAQSKLTPEQAKEIRDILRKGVKNDFTQDERRTFSDLFKKCWLTSTAREEKNVEITLHFDRSGMFSKPPEFKNISAKNFPSAVEAIYKCQPYKLPAEKYDFWKSIMLVLD